MTETDEQREDPRDWRVPRMRADVRYAVGPLQTPHGRAWGRRAAASWPFGVDSLKGVGAGIFARLDRQKSVLGRGWRSCQRM